MPDSLLRCPGSRKLDLRMQKWIKKQIAELEELDADVDPLQDGLDLADLINETAKLRCRCRPTRSRSSVSDKIGSGRGGTRTASAE